MTPELAVRDEFNWTVDVFKSREVALTHHAKLQEWFDELINQINETKIVIPRDESNSYFRGGANKESCYYLTDQINATAVSHLFPSRARGIGLKIFEAWKCYISFGYRKMETITGLSDFFASDQRVSSCPGYDREGQEYLGAGLRMKRRPDHCFLWHSLIVDRCLRSRNQGRDLLYGGLTGSCAMKPLKQ